MIEFVSGGDLMYHMQRQRRLPEDHARYSITLKSHVLFCLNYGTSHSLVAQKHTYLKRSVNR